LNLKCSDGEKNLLCKQQCGSLLGCGHPCQGLCGDCAKQKHPLCSSMCDRERPCGHFCRSTCHEGHACPPCDQLCSESCAHGPCPNRCGTACDPCVKPHKPRCDHQQRSSMLCSLPSDAVPCSTPCQNSMFILSYYPWHS
jgi:hypothetical protein